MKYIEAIISILICFIFSCSEKHISQNNQNQVTERLSGFEKINNKDLYIIRYSNVIVHLNGKTIKLPIYGGIYGDIESDKLNIEQPFKDVFLLQTIYIPVKKDHATETFRDIIKFYKKSLLKNVDVNKPTDFYSENSLNYFIVYVFVYNGVPSRMIINAEIDVLNSKIENLILKEKDGFIGITFSIGGKNP